MFHNVGMADRFHFSRECPRAHLPMPTWVKLAIDAWNTAAVSGERSGI
jgi:hypothetical protein